MWLVHFTLVVLLSPCLSDNSSKLTLHIRSRYSIIACATWSTIQTHQMPCYTQCTTHTSKEHTHSLTHSASEAVRVPLLIQGLPCVKNFPQHRTHVQIVASANNAKSTKYCAVSFTARGGKCVPCVHVHKVSVQEASVYAGTHKW